MQMFLCWKDASQFCSHLTLMQISIAHDGPASCPMQSHQLAVWKIGFLTILDLQPAAEVDVMSW